MSGVSCSLNFLQLVGSITHTLPWLKMECRKYRVSFLTGPALKVLSVGDGKIPTKKVKVRVSYRENMKF